MKLLDLIISNSILCMLHDFNSFNSYKIFIEAAIILTDLQRQKSLLAYLEIACSKNQNHKGASHQVAIINQLTDLHMIRAPTERNPWIHFNVYNSTELKTLVLSKTVFSMLLYIILLYNLNKLLYKSNTRAFTMSTQLNIKWAKTVHIAQKLDIPAYNSFFKKKKVHTWIFFMSTKCTAHDHFSNCVLNGTSTIT